MPGQRLTDDKKLPNGSIVYWSRREDPYVPVKCGQCGRERMILFNNCTRQTFDGICRQCTNGEAWQDTTLSNGSIVFWSRRKYQKVPVKCGRCGKEHISHGLNIRKENFTGLCKRCVATGENGNAWKGGRTIKAGYVQVKIYPDHPFYKLMASTTGYVPEHRLVVAQHLGRPLSSKEVVHHKNGDKLDNRIENLELYSSFKEHGHALQNRNPHPGFVPADKLNKIIALVKKMLENDNE